MKTLILVCASCLLGLPVTVSGEPVPPEELYLGFLHQLQYVETSADLMKLIPGCPAPVPDVGENNTEILLKTKLFGQPAAGEFNFHNDILVSHGFQISSLDYKGAHRAFLQAWTILEGQVKELKPTVELPDSPDADNTDGVTDKISIYGEGVVMDASFQVRLEMRENSIAVGWGAQKASSEQKKDTIQKQATGTERPVE